MQSWRLLILPFLDSSTTYSECNFNEPWDRPSNTKFRTDRKYIYKCPADPTLCAPDSNTTSYLALVGRDAGWRRSRNSGAEDNGPREKGAKTGNGTFLVIEKTNSGIQWAEPRDIRLDDLQALQSLATNGPHVRDNGYFFQKTREANAVLLIGDMTFFFPSDSYTGVFAGLLPPREERSGTEHGPKYIPPQFYVEEIPVNWAHCIDLPSGLLQWACWSYGGLEAVGDHRLRSVSQPATSSYRYSLHPMGCEGYAAIAGRNASSYFSWLNPSRQDEMSLDNGECHGNTLRNHSAHGAFDCDRRTLVGGREPQCAGRVAVACGNHISHPLCGPRAALYGAGARAHLVRSG